MMALLTLRVWEVLLLPSHQALCLTKINCLFHSQPTVLSRQQETSSFCLHSHRVLRVDMGLFLCCPFSASTMPCRQERAKRCVHSKKGPPVPASEPPLLAGYLQSSKTVLSPWLNTPLLKKPVGNEIFFFSLGSKNRAGRGRQPRRSRPALPWAFCHPHRSEDV